jgi:WD40 repeat protein
MKSRSNPDDQPKGPGNQVGGDKIQSGDIAGSVAAIGAGASVIYSKVERALTEIETKKQAEKFESKQLAQALKDYVHRLENQATKAQDDPRAGNPYKALLEFDIQDTALFYGRSTAIQELLAHLNRDQLTVLHAGSGAGKTSLLKAGIIPRLLADGHLPLYVRPYATPVHLAIKQALLVNLGDTPNLASMPLHDFLRRATALISGRQFVVIIDQFEELFTVQSEGDRKEFIDQLCSCLDDDLLPVRWIIALRDEWFGRLGTFRPSIRNPYANEFLLRPLSREEAVEVIAQPARRLHIRYEPALVDRLLDDLGKDEITPPHLQLVCSMLFDSLDGKSKITQAMYDEAGQAKGILREHLYRVLSRDVPSELRAPARRLLEALVTSEKRRALRTREDLTAELLAWNYPQPMIDQVLNQLIDSRLLRVEEFMVDKLNSVVAYELAHDYLLDEIEIDPEVQARKAAQELLNQKVPFYKREKLLLSPEELAIILPQRRWLNLSEDAAALLGESVAVATRQKRMRRMGIAAAVLLGLTAMAAFAIQRNIAAGSNERIASTAVAAQEISLAGELAARAELNKNLGEVIPAYENAVLSYRTANTYESRSVLYTALSLPLPERIFRFADDQVRVVNFSPDGDRMVTVGSEGMARLWDVKNGQELFALEAPEAAITFAAFSPDGMRIVTASTVGTAIVWDAQNGSMIQTIPAHEDRVISAVFSLDSTLIVTASRDQTAAIWEVSSGNELARLEGHEGPVRFADFSPDGSRIVTASNDGTARVWELTGTEILKLEGHTDQVTYAAFSPDGTQIITAGADRTARLWDAETGDTIAFLVPHNGDVTSADFSPDGSFIITTSADHLVRLWNASEGTLFAVFPGHIDEIRWGSISPDGRWIATASNDSTVLLRETFRIAGSPSFIGQAGGINTVNFNKDGTQFVTASADGTAWVWDAARRQQPLALEGHEDGVHYAAFSPDGTIIVTTSADETVRVWDAVTGEELDQLPGEAFSVNFSPDGSQFVTAAEDDFAQVWDTRTREEILPALVGHLDDVMYASFSPDGTRIVTAGGEDDGTVRIWDAMTHYLLETIPIIKNNEVNAVNFSPDGKQLVIAADAGISDEGIAQVWNIDPLEIAFRLVGHKSDVRSANYSPDGRLIVTASEDGTVRLWEAGSGMPVAVLRGHHADVHWATFSPDGKWIFSASPDRTVRTWLVDFEELYTFIIEELGRLKTNSMEISPAVSITLTETATVGFTSTLSPTVAASTTTPTLESTTTPSSTVGASTTAPSATATWPTVTSRPRDTATPRPPTHPPPTVPPTYIPTTEPTTYP